MMGAQTRLTLSLILEGENPEDYGYILDIYNVSWTWFLTYTPTHT